MSADTNKVGIIAKLTAQEGKRDELLAVIAEQGMANVAGEAGTEMYIAHADQGDDNVVWFYELYTDGDAVALHGGSDGMKALGKSMAPFMGARPEIIMLSPSSAKGVDL